MTAFITALAATWWPLLVPIGLMVAFGLWLDRRWERRLTREALARQAGDLALQGSLTEQCRQRHSAQKPRERGQDVADPWGRSVYDPQRAVEFEVEHRPRWET